VIWHYGLHHKVTGGSPPDCQNALGRRTRSLGAEVNELERQARGRRGAHSEIAAKPTDSAGRPGFSWPRLIPLVVLVAGLLAFFSLGLHRYASLDTLRDHRQWLLDEVDRLGILAPAIFLFGYALATALSVPGGLVLTIAGGFLFGLFQGTLVVVIGASIGATIVFLAAKTALGDVLRARAGTAMQRMEAGFRDNAMSYLLVLRLVPLFPFFLVNLVPAFLGVPLRTYVVATVVGIIPGTFVYVSVGNGLGEVFAAGGTADLGIIFRPAVLLPLLGLALLSLLPVIYKRVSARRRAGHN